MSYSVLKTSTAVFVALGIVSGAAAPIVMQAPVHAQSAFPDVPSNYWANNFIQELVQRGVIAGFPDGTFRPEEPVTRAQYAAMLRKAFEKPSTRSGVQFVDVPSGYWAEAAIQYAYTTGFMAGYPGNEFRPDENIPRAQVLVSLANGLEYAATNPVDTVLLAFQDSNTIPNYARTSIAAATEQRIVVNYPNVRILSPNRVATRAEVAAFIYQALVSQGEAVAINSPYIVGQQVTPTVRIPAGTQIPAVYSQTDRILLYQDEPKPFPTTLQVAQNIVSSDGTVLIPAGSSIVGEFRTTKQGAQFFAQEVVYANGRRLPMSATSELITATETIRKGASAGDILIGTVVGAGAAAGIAGVTGDRNIAADETLIGAGVGALASVFLGRERVDLFAINPDTNLALTLSSDLVIPPAPSPR